MDLGQTLKLAAEAFTRQFVPFCTATLIYMVGLGAIGATASWLFPVIAPLVGVVGGSLLIGGLAHMGLEAVTGDAVDASDSFESLSRPVDFVMVGVAIQAGVLLCGVGLLLTQTLFLFAPIFVAEGDDFGKALGRSKELAMANLQDVALFGLVMLGLNVIAMGVTCGLGAAVSFPLTMLATIRLYHQLTGTEPPDRSMRPPRPSQGGSLNPSVRPSSPPSKRP